MPASIPVDTVVLGLLLAFALWGAWQGPLRMLFSLVVIGLAFPVAMRIAPRLEDVVVKAVSLGETDVVRAAWLVAFLGTVILGGLLFAALRPLLARWRPPTPPRRLLGALLGIVQGTVVSALLLYAAMIVLGGSPGSELAGSRAAEGARVVVGGMRDVLPLPTWLREEMGAVDRRIREAGPQGSGR